MDTPSGRGSGVSARPQTQGRYAPAPQPSAAQWMKRFTCGRSEFAPPFGIHRTAPHYDLPDGHSSRQAAAERIVKK